MKKGLTNTSEAQAIKDDAFGVEKNPDPNDTNVFRYCGEYFDRETGTIYLRARHYDPEIGRFITEDSYRGKKSDPLSLNLYTYCFNNPVMYFDPDGHWPQWAQDLWNDFKSAYKSHQTSGNILYDEINFWTMGLPDSVKTAMNSKPFSAENLTANVEILMYLMPELKSQKALVQTGFKVTKVSAKGLIGKDFEDYLVKYLGGKGSFKAEGREFDGAFGNVWYEAKSGNYWDMLMSKEKELAKFKDSMGQRLGIAKDNGATYSLYSNTPIPKEIKDWLTKKGIKYVEVK